FVKKMWSEILPTYFEKGVFNFEMIVGSIEKKEFIPSSEINKFKIVNVNQINWPNFSPVLQSKADRILFNTFGLNEYEFNCNHLREVLQREKLEFQRKVKILLDENNTPLFYLIRLGLPPLSNATSITE